MQVHTTPGFRHRVEEPRWFVAQLSAADSRYSSGSRYEVQLLNEAGQGEAFVLFNAGEVGALPRGLEVPALVLEAALRQSPGTGDYVNAQGLSTQPF